MKLIPLALVLLAQVDPVTVNDSIHWHRPIVNQDGTELTDLHGFKFSVAPEGIDLTQAGVVELQSWLLEGEQLPDCPGDECQVSARDVFEGLPDGRYRVWVQAYDLAGNVSPHEQGAASAAFDFDADIPFDDVSPGAPSDVRIIRSRAKQIRITIEVPTE